MDAVGTGLLGNFDEIIDYQWHACGTADETDCFSHVDDFLAGFLFRAKLNNVRAAVAKLARQLGLSSHSPEQAERAIQAGADYIAIGPVFATGTKPGRTPVTLDYVRWAAAHVSIPWFAIGGITLENLDEVLLAGARRICVVSAILNASDIGEACRTFKKRLAT